MTAPLQAGRKIVIRNLYLLLACVFGIAGGLGYFVLRQGSLLGWGGLLLAMCCLWLCWLELRGIVLNDSFLFFPDRKAALFPLLALGRKKIGYSGVRDITALPPWCGMEMISIEGEFGRAFLLFHSRNARLKFFASLQAKAPSIKIYRAA